MILTSNLSLVVDIIKLIEFYLIFGRNWLRTQRKHTKIMSFDKTLTLRNRCTKNIDN